MRTRILCLLLSLFCIKSALPQAPGCPSITAPADFTLPCTTPCTTLTATPFHVGATTSYTVSSIPYAPVITPGSAGGTAVSAGTDDVWSPIITLPFPFCYFGGTYTTCKVGSNGAVLFGPATGGGFNTWSIPATSVCPSPALWGTGATGHAFGAFHDMYPPVSGQIKWHLIGTAPCRMFVVDFYNCSHYSCTSLRSFFQMVFYETTNVIETHIQRKDACMTWNGGRAIVGVQNTGGTAGIAAPGRNASSGAWTVVTSSPEAWRFTPNGAPVYTVSWYDGATLLGTGNSISVCPTTTTTYTATAVYTRCDGVTVTVSDPVTITMSSLPAPVVTPIAETCAGYNNGSVTINNTPGPGPFTVTISGPASGTVVEPNTALGVASFTSLPDGVYTYTVTSAAGCGYTGTFTINPGPPCCSVTAAGTNVLCNGGTTGTLTATPTGVPGFTYSWTTTPVQTTATATGVPAGTYTVTITDATGCVATTNVTITEPTAITVSTTNVNPLCNGGSTGSITVTASGGTGALQYSLNGGAYQVSNVFTGLAAGTYTISVKDANGCIQTFTTTLTNPPLLTASLSGTTPATCGVNNGTITINASGGTGALSYDLNPGPTQPSNVFTGLAAGTYSVVVTDANGCTATVSSITVGSAPAPTLSASATNLTCFGGVNGSVLLTPSGGSPAFSYTIDLAGPTPPVGPQASNSFTGLGAGTYTATVTDANGCSGTTTFTITSPPALTYTTTFTNASCNGVCDGTITVTPSGGTPGYQFSSNNGLTFSPANPMTGLCAGTIFVVVQDANGCLANSTVVISQPAAITTTVNFTDPVCQGICDGTITATGTAGGSPAYQYQLDPFGPTPPGPIQPTGSFTGLCDGTYTLIIEDANGCQLTNTVVLTDPPGFTISIVDTVESHCGFNDGSLEVAASGGTAPYTYDNVTIGSGPMPTGLFSGLTSGGYNIVVTDANGCTENMFVGVNDVEMDGILDGVTNATCYGSCDGTVQTHAVNGAPPIQYELDLSGTFTVSGNYTGLCAGSHIVTIVDNGFCVFTIPFSITEPDSILYTPVTTNIACNGAPTGTITFTAVTGGDGGPYQYSIDNGTTYQASPNFTGLTAGTYDLMVMDGNGCLGWNQAIITEATPITYAASITDLNCNGDNSGIILIAANGGTPGYTYSINGGVTFQASLAFPGLAAGTYNIVIQDAAGCQVTGTETVNEPAALTATYTITPTLCNGSCDGEILVNASGGTTPYQYSSDNGTTFQVSNNLIGLCAGAYQVVTEDSHGCSITSTEAVTQPTSITYNTTITPSTCGNPNGSIGFIGVAGGTPAYQYSIDNGATFQALPNFTGLAAGTYDIMVEDANGCQEPQTVTVIDQASPVITSAFVTNVTCNAACDGALSSSATGGTGALSFDIGGAGQPTGNFTGICAGTYTLTVTDGNGCTDTQPFTVIEPTVLAFTSSGVNLTCFGDNSGEITFTPSGGTTAYLFSYDGGATFTTLSTQTNPAAGTYNLVLQDANGCTATGTQTLTEPAQLAITSQPQTNVTCFGACDGTATLNITGGTVAALYNYNWAGGVAGPTQNNATNLCAGTYPVTVTDDNGCTINASFTITEPPQVVITGFSFSDVTCNGACDGTVNIIAPAATQFSVDGGATFSASPNFTGLCPGTYSIIAQDAGGCQTTTTATITEPLPLIQNPIADITICYGGYGQLDASATGGTPPYTFTWNTGDIAQYYFVTSTVPVTFTCVVTDQNGCTSNPESANVSIIPPFVASVVSATDTVCPGGQATFQASGADGVPGYNYWWYDANWNPIDSLSNDSVFVTPNVTTNGATFNLLAFDQCPLNDTIVLTVYFHPLPQPTFVPVPGAGCSPLDVTFVNTTPSSMTSGGACTWDFGDGNTGTGCVTVTNTYYNTTNASVFFDVTLTTTSDQGCTNDSTYVNAIEVYADPVPDFTFNPTQPTILEPEVNFVNLTFNGATYAWDFAGTDSSNQVHPTYSFNQVEAGDYTVCLEAVSPDGCIAQVCKPIHIYDVMLIYVPNAFTPDGDGTNDMLLPSVKGVLDDGYVFYVFDRWGEIIFQTNDKLSGWDGTFKGMPSKEDVYVWKIKAASSLNGDVKEYVGHVTLLK
ncbi:MAG TPA: T9SS type B sorting domain-containing protein [Flavobacteriales bacterium]|nr:T9SS type B sorting domain-containing protein [Flavobacteriales bacterium]